MFFCISMRFRAFQVDWDTPFFFFKSKARGSKATENASAKHKMRESEATENTSVKHKALGSYNRLTIGVRSLREQSAKPEGASLKRHKGPRKASEKWRLHCINPKGNFILSPQEQRQGPRFKVSSERLSLEIDIHVLILSPIPTLTEPDNAQLCLQLTVSACQ